MEYTVLLHPTPQGFVVSVLGLPDCWSYGANEHEALQNIQHAIKEHLAHLQKFSPTDFTRQIEVA